jgi:hydroxypyruvate isomerase
MNRRKTIKLFALGAATLASEAVPAHGLFPFSKIPEGPAGKIRHSVCRWTYDFLPLDALCRAVKAMGVDAIDLVGPGDWEILKSNGMHCSMCNGAEISLTEGWNDRQYHARLIDNYRKHIQLVSAAGYANLICFSGNRRGMDEETGLRHCVEGLKQILGEAEKKQVVIQLEVFNSKVDHPDYMADNTRWALELCKRIGSPNFKILYDIYHMQISEGDIIHTIRTQHPHFGHYHTAGVPGRHEINESQELNYPAIMKAIADTGFTGHVAQEFIPTGTTNREKLDALRDAFARCTV